MPTVTKIVLQQNKNRANIFLDGKFSFAIPLDLIFKYKLKTEKELDKELIKKLKKQGSEELIHTRLINFATLRPRSAREIKNWLRKKSVKKEITHKLFNRLKSLNLANDKDFARWWIEQRVNFRKISRKLIEKELKSKGVAKEIIEDTLQAAHIPPETELAKSALLKKLRNKNIENIKIQKIYNFLLRKGFSWETIKRAIDEVKTKE